ncbi:MAG: ABC transporter substrate-binding protein [Lachnospiraceae bacterium]|nr:ABC transporter substrate-binding protein [Lachnospiraceae bacterium]
MNEGTTSAPDESFAENMNEEPSLIGPMELSYATEYSVDLYEHGYAHIHVADGNSYVLIPEGKPVVSLGDEDATIIQMPCDSIYLAASSVMDLFHELEALENIRSCSTKAEDYGNQEVQTAIESGNIQYVGKYSAPDYEQLIMNQTCLAIESTMIYHSPKIKEELEGLGIPVLVERSSYEGNPLGRLEWIKLYGLLLGKRELAEELFEKQMENVNSVLASLDESEKEKPKVLFFYLSSNGYVNVRKPGDYVSKMIAMAGGEYAMDSLQIDEENALSTVNISWEDFYYYGKDADIIIYNGTIDGGITSKEDLLQQNALFQEFKAVQENRVYCSTGNMYQESSKIGEIIENLYAVIHQKETTLDYIKYVD